MAEENRVRFDWLPEFPFAAAGAPARFHVLVTAQAPPSRRDRAPLNLCLVLDRSGSMRGEKLRYTLESARILVDHLTERDQLAVVFYDSEVETVLPPTPVRDRDRLRKTLENVRARGTTNLSGGWLQGIRLAEKARVKGGVNRVLLMTDGLANRGIVDPPALREISEKSRRKGIITTTLGFGRGFNEDLLTAVATAAGGNFYYIENPDDAPRAFSGELGELMGLSAQNLQGRFRFAEGVRLAEVLNSFPAKREGSVLEIFAGDVFSGDRRTILLALEAGGPEGERALFEAEFEYDDLAEGGESRGATLRAALPFRTPGPAAGQRDATVSLAVALARAGKAKLRAKGLADRGELGEAAKLLDEALRGLDDQPDLPEVLQERKDLRLFADEFRRSSWNANERKSLSASIFRTQVGRLSAGPGKVVDTRVEEGKKKPPPTKS